MMCCVHAGRVHITSSTCNVSCPMCPCFATAPYEVSVSENTPIGSTVFTATATDPNGDVLLYTLVSTSDFVIDNSGHIIVSVDMDYELTSLYHFQVRASDSDGFHIADITINVINEDDNAPICNESIVVYSILEGDTSVSLGPLACSDADDSSNSGLIYTTVSGNESGTFFVSTQGFITLSQALDYELQTSHVLQLRVVDTIGAADTGIDSTVIAILQVQPVNEHPPEFSSSMFSCSVSEAASVGSDICMVLASDDDAGNDGLMDFAIHHGNVNELEIFHIDSGVISLIQELDYESVTSYEFTVVVSDRSLEENTQLTSTTTVVIDVVDVNDNSPIFSQDIYYVEVTENAGIHHNVIEVICSDSDSGDIGSIRYAVTSGNDDAIFEIDAQSGRVRLTATLDIDGSNGAEFHLLTLLCANTRPPGLSDTAILVVQVVSYNEFFPDPGSDYVASVSESQQLGTRIIQINGTDRDAGLAGTLTYSLDLMCPANFFIDSVTGSVYLVRPLDFEVGSTTFYCIVEVWDSELPLRPSEADLEIRLIDVNDYAPQCTPSFHFVYVPEDTVGDDILSFACTDQDTADLTFTLVDDAAGAIMPFRVRSVGRQAFISVAHSLDFEMQSEYTLLIVAFDGHAFSNVTVYIFVEDINEYAPRFSVSSLSYTLPESSPQGTLVCQLSASDADGSDDAMIRYNLLNGSSVFTVEQVTGEIFLSGLIDHEVASDYVITVQADDFGHPNSLSSTAHVVIVVEDVNDNSPVMPSLLTVSIPENATLGTAVTALSCTDEDTGIIELNTATIFEIDNNGIERQLVTNFFAIDHVSSVLILNGAIDYERVRQYRVVVVCTDLGVPPLSTSGTISVEITPINEFAPISLSRSQSVNVSEVTAIGTNILNVSATDEDYGNDGRIYYSLIDVGVPFFIDPQIGTISVSKSLDCEQSTVYNITVQASDGGVPAMQAVSDAVINIVDCSLGDLLPDRSIYVAEVVENAPSGTPLLAVVCRSTRTNIERPLNPVYSIVSPLADYFRVGATSGEVVVGDLLPDYESQSSFTISVECRDPNYSFVSANFVIYVSVTPLNEHPPIIRNVSVSVFENVALGSHIYTVEAFDDDLGDDGEIVFSIPDVNAPVIIDPHAGMVYITRSLDYETMDSFSFTVSAQDSPRDFLSSRSSSAVVSVTVLDSNDHWPECDRTVYHLVVSPFTRAGTILTSLTCTDADEGSNANLEYFIRGNESASLFQVRTNGDLILTDSFSTEIVNVRVEVRDQGVPPLSTIVLVVVEPYVGRSDDNNDSNSPEAEGVRNSVTMTLQDLSTELVSKCIATTHREMSLYHLCLCSGEMEVLKTF